MMDVPDSDNVVAAIKQVAAYGGQLASVFHTYALTARRLPRGLEGAINILDATTTSLNQFLDLFKKAAESLENGSNRRLFNDEGLKYVLLLTTLCGIALAEVEPIVKDACLGRKELKAKRKLQKSKFETLAKGDVPELDLSSLKLDENALLETIECTKWNYVSTHIELCVDALYDLQLHLQLVSQVAWVGFLSGEVSNGGKVDVKSIVAFHDRIIRTADLVGIELPNDFLRNRRMGYDSFNDDGSSYDSSGSDSDVSSIISFDRRKKFSRPGPPPPPPPSNWPGGLPHLPSTLPPPPPPSNWPGGPPRAPPFSKPEAVKPPGSPIEIGKPPAYSESHKAELNGVPTPAASTLPSRSVNSVIPPSIVVKTPQSEAYPPEKETSNEELAEGTTVTKPPPLEPRLFKSKPNGLGFKLRTLFRSKESLAEEMKRVLSDTDSYLSAFLIRCTDFRQVPHSAFHSLEATHMRTILSQMNDNSWYKTFSSLSSLEYHTLSRLIHPFACCTEDEKEVVVLKVVQESKLNAWMALFRDGLPRHPYPHNTNNRIILAILREKFVDGKRAPTLFPAPPVIRAPGPLPSPPRVVPTIRPPKGLQPSPRPPRISDLSRTGGLPPPPPFGWDSNRSFGGSIPRPGELPLPPGPPPSAYVSAEQKSSSIRISDTTPLTDYNATIALTSYNEYTLRPTEPLDPTMPRSWQRVSITQETSEQHIVQQRVQEFKGNIIETKLRLAEYQSGQVTRLMDELKYGEKDNRFEWCLVALSLYNQAAEINLSSAPTSAFGCTTATVMHVIAKRMPKPQHSPLELYNSLMKPTAPALPAPGYRAAPFAGAPPGPGAPPPLPGPPSIVVLARNGGGKSRSGKKTSSLYSISSGYGSDSDSIASSDTSVGVVRRSLRKSRARMKREDRKRRRRYCYDSESEDEDEDTFVITPVLKLNRNDDLVEALLDLWTPRNEGKGKEKMTV